MFYYWETPWSAEDALKILEGDAQIGSWGNPGDWVSPDYVHRRYFLFQNGNCIGYIPDDVMDAMVKSGQVIARSWTLAGKLKS